MPPLRHPASVYCAHIQAAIAIDYKVAIISTLLYNIINMEKPELFGAPTPKYERPVRHYNEIEEKLVGQLRADVAPDEQMEGRALLLYKAKDPKYVYDACDVLHEMAMRTTDEGEAFRWETMAQEGFSWLAENYGYERAGSQNHIYLAAQKQLAYSSLYLLGIVAPEQPTDEVRQHTYDTLANIAVEARDRTKLLLRKSLEGHFVGEMAEISVLLLLQRHGLQFSDASYWWPFPSMASQGFQQKDTSHRLNHNWDISVLTRFDEEEPLDIAHRIEVKNKDVGDRNKDYTYDRATVIRLSDIVRRVILPNEAYPLVIPRLVDLENQGYGQATELLDQATERLLDRLD